MTAFPADRLPRTRCALANRVTLAWGMLLASALCVAAQAQTPPALPGFAELEAAGATIGDIRVVNKNIFDTDDPKEDKLLFRAVNALHIGTRAKVIEDALLFKRGEPLSTVLIEETERVLRNSRYLHDVAIVPVRYQDGVVDIEVKTHDTWSLDPGISLSRTGGATSSGIKLKELNLLGTGIAVSYGRSRNVDRSSNEFEISDDRAFGGWTAISYSRANNSDGQRHAASIGQPFYALDSPWAASAKGSKDDRIDSVYNAGEVVSQYRHRENLAELVGGLSEGRVEGWVRRYSLGFTHETQGYAIEPGLLAPARLPADEKLVGPFFRFEAIEDRFEKVLNRNQIGRPEFFALGLNSTLQLGRADRRLGSSRDAWLYSGTVSRGFVPAPDHTLIASASLSGQYSGGQARRLRFGGEAQYYMPQSKHWLFYGAASFDTLSRPDPNETLLLGGDSGLRGYPLRYQSGQRRALFTLEERAYSDLYLYRLFRVGGAAFLDVGRAWGGDNVNRQQPGWLGNVGIGLRIFSVRSAFGNVLHADIAFPLDPDTKVKKAQYLVKTRTSF
ncbi:MAG: hypothetical protein OEY03_12320 [Rhizobacter sp.]|nr:hypothetical protein [Rhizobacter sp.]